MARGRHAVMGNIFHCLLLLLDMCAIFTRVYLIGRFHLYNFFFLVLILLVRIKNGILKCTTRLINNAINADLPWFSYFRVNDF